MKKTLVILITLSFLTTPKFSFATDEDFSTNKISSGLNLDVDPPPFESGLAELKLKAKPEDLPATVEYKNKVNPWLLALEGAALAIPQYFLNVTMHEGSHSLAVVISGGDVTKFKILPETINGVFYFGYMEYRGTFSKVQSTMINIAPKITDVAIMGAYTALFETGAYPEDPRLQILLLVAATGSWVDFMHDIASKSPANDLIKTYNMWGLDTEAERLPFRLFQGLVGLGFGIEIGRGIYHMIKSNKVAVTKEEDQVKKTKSGKVLVSPSFIGYGGSF